MVQSGSMEKIIEDGIYPQLLGVGHYVPFWSTRTAFCRKKTMLKHEQEN